MPNKQDQLGGSFRFFLLIAAIASGCSAETQGPDQKKDASPQGGASGTGGGTGGTVTPGTGGNTGAGTGGAAQDGGRSGRGGAAGGGGVAETGGATGGGAGTKNDAGTDAQGRGGAAGSSPGDAGGGAGTSGSDAAVGKDSAGPDLPPIPDALVRLDTAQAFWSASYNASCSPAAIGGRAQADGHHRAGEDCMRSGCHLNPKKAEHHAGTDCRGSGCHANGSPDGSGAPAFLFGGTVYRAVTLAPDKGVEVAVKTASSSYSACSATNGNFWMVSGTSAITWAGAQVRLRNANGEAAMMTAVAAGCNASTCHSGTLKMTSP